MYGNLCKKCYIKEYNLSKKDIRKIIMTSEKDRCDCCNRTDYIVDYFADEE